MCFVFSAHLGVSLVAVKTARETPKCARSNSSGGVIVHLRSLLRIGVAQKIGAHRRRSEIQINLLFVMRVTCFVLLERLQNRSIRFPRPLRLLHRDIAGARSFSRSFRP